jgi:hypothetical protein
METLKEKKRNLWDLLEASYDGDVAAVRALLKRGNVDVNGVYGGEVRLLFAPALTCRLAFVRTRVGAVDVASASSITHELSVW